MSDISTITVGGVTYNLKDGAVPDWAKEDSKPSYSADEVDAVPASTGGTFNGALTVNGTIEIPKSSSGHIITRNGNVYAQLCTDGTNIDSYVSVSQNGGLGLHHASHGGYIEFYLPGSTKSGGDGRISFDGKKNSSSTTYDTIRITTPIIVENHSTAIGSLVSSASSTATSITAETWTNLSSMTLPAGTWMIYAEAQFNSAGSSYTGQHKMGLTIHTANTSYNSYCLEYVDSQGSTASYLNCSCVYNYTSSTTVYLNVYVDAKRNVIPRMFRAVRIT